MTHTTKDRGVATAPVRPPGSHTATPDHMHPEVNMIPTCTNGRRTCR